jgi:DNA replication protein DnaC
MEAGERNATTKARREHWKELCPVEFRTPDEDGGHTDVNRLRLEQAKFAEAMSWTYGKRGLLLVGPSGTCKTRVMWRIVRREFDAGRKVIAMKAHRFGIEAVERQMTKGFAQWFNELARAPLLFIDDLGKGKFTDAVESHFFGLIDERTEHNRPIVITTNSTGTALAARMSEDRGEPIVRRLKDYCDSVVFNH